MMESWTWYSLSQEREITLPLAKAAVNKDHGRIGRASPFDAERSSQGSNSEPEVSQDQVDTELLEFFKGLQMFQANSHIH